MEAMLETVVSVDLSVTVCGISLRNPVMPASEWFGPERAPLLPASKLGAVVTKTVFAMHRAGNPANRLTETTYGMLNSVGIPSLGSIRFQYGLLRQYQAMVAPVIVMAFGWRGLFVVGVLPAVVAIVLRKKLHESPKFLKHKEQEQSAVGSRRSSLLMLVKDKRTVRITIAMIILTSVQNFGYFGIIAWLPRYLATEFRFDLTTSGLWTGVTVLGMLTGILSFGQLADRIGRRKSFWIFQIGAAASVLIYSQLSDPTALLLGGFVMGSFANGMLGSYGALMAELYPTAAGPRRKMCSSTSAAVSAISHRWSSHSSRSATDSPLCSACSRVSTCSPSQPCSSCPNGAAPNSNSRKGKPLIMTILTASTPPTVLQDEAERRHDLVADISALMTNGTLDSSSLQSRPAILRRLAALLAQVLPPGVDRLMSRASIDAPLATAVALHSGVSFALLDDDGRVLLGDLHPSERVVLIETLPTARTDELSVQLRDVGADLIGVMTAVVPDALDHAAVDAFVLATFRPTRPGGRS